MQGSGHCNGSASLYTEQTFRETMDMMVSSGLAKHYRLILVDDCWMAETRNPSTGELQADQTRFPSGMAALIAYAHERGFHFGAPHVCVCVCVDVHKSSGAFCSSTPGHLIVTGIYAAAGAETCRNFPGSLGREALDAATFARWGADYVKLDACGSAPLGGPQWRPQYAKWSAALRAQNHTMSFSCSWPACKLQSPFPRFKARGP